MDLLQGDAKAVLETLADESVQCCVTSPPYWGLRDYGVEGQFGLEKTPEEYVGKLVDIMREARRVLRNDGTLWLNLGDCYATGAGSARSPGGSAFGKSNSVVDSGAFPRSQPNRMPIPGLKPKDLVGMPWRVALALQADGWWLRNDIIWHKPNLMPLSVRDRFTGSHEYIFFLAKSQKYFFDQEAVKEPVSEATSKRYGSGWNGDRRRGYRTGGNNFDKCFAKPAPEKRNRRTVWTVVNHGLKGAHFATFPPALIEPCILAGSRIGDVVLDPFSGAGTTGLVALKHGREYVGIEINPDYIALTQERLKGA